MPELPEVETIKRSLEPVCGRRVVEVIEVNPVVVKRRDFSASSLVGCVLKQVARRGKYLVLEFDEDHFMVVHLGMSGRFYRMASSEERAKHTHFIVKLEGGEELRYWDPRRFGGVWLVSKPAELFTALGPEPFTDDFCQEYLQERFHGRKAAIKSLLLDQSVVAGIGNIYADEILFAAGIHPARPAGSLSAEELERLCKVTGEVLGRGIDCRGTTFRDYRDGNNERGGFQDFLTVYSREGEPCTVCGQQICRIKLGGRSSHYCPCCQK